MWDRSHFPNPRTKNQQKTNKNQKNLSHCPRSVSGVGEAAQGQRESNEARGTGLPIDLLVGGGEVFGHNLGIA